MGRWEDRKMVLAPGGRDGFDIGVDGRCFEDFEEELVRLVVSNEVILEGRVAEAMGMEDEME